MTSQQCAELVCILDIMQGCKGGFGCSWPRGCKRYGWQCRARSFRVTSCAMGSFPCHGRYGVMGAWVLVVQDEELPGSFPCHGRKLLLLWVTGLGHAAAGFNVEQQNNDGMTPLHSTTQYPCI